MQTPSRGQRKGALYYRCTDSRKQDVEQIYLERKEIAREYYKRLKNIIESYNCLIPPDHGEIYAMRQADRFLEENDQDKKDTREEK